jgi:hypothetical protein
MQITEIIDKWHLNKAHLACKLEMTKSTFRNKLLSSSFTEDEMILLRCALIELRNDLEAVDEIDFDTAMRLIAQKKV